MVGAGRGYPSCSAEDASERAGYREHYVDAEHDGSDSHQGVLSVPIDGRLMMGRDVPQDGKQWHRNEDDQPSRRAELDTSELPVVLLLYPDLANSGIHFNVVGGVVSLIVLHISDKDGAPIDAYVHLARRQLVTRKVGAARQSTNIRYREECLLAASMCCSSVTARSCAPLRSSYALPPRLRSGSPTPRARRGPRWRCRPRSSSRSRTRSRTSPADCSAHRSATGGAALILVQSSSTYSRCASITRGSSSEVTVPRRRKASLTQLSGLHVPRRMLGAKGRASQSLVLLGGCTFLSRPQGGRPIANAHVNREWIAGYPTRIAYSRSPYSPGGGGFAKDRLGRAGARHHGQRCGSGAASSTSNLWPF